MKVLYSSSKDHFYGITNDYAEWNPIQSRLGSIHLSFPVPEDAKLVKPKKIIEDPIPQETDSEEEGKVNYEFQNVNETHRYTHSDGILKIIRTIETDENARKIWLKKKSDEAKDITPESLDSA